MRKLRLVSAVILIAATVCFSGCVQYKTWMPQDGPWFCEDLQIQITFSYGDCYAIIDETQVHCDCINYQGSKCFFVTTQEPATGVPMGTCLLEAEYIQLTDDTFTVKEYHTGTIYTFIKVTP